MSTTKSNLIPINGSRNKSRQAKITFIGGTKLQIKKMEKFAKDNHFEFQTYTHDEWATFEEIDQYIQEEELSKQVINLPVGTNTVSSLDELESEAIRKVLLNFNGNVIKAAQTLKIARATIYRKMERYGLNLKKKRENLLKRKYRKNFKRVA